MSETKPLFRLGLLLATPGAVKALKAAQQDPFVLVNRHQSGDWGELVEADKKENEFAVKHGFRIMSRYRLSTGEVLWVITEWDRSATTLLLPGEY